jgi:tRNA G26 N,N-dimethylase Trm1
MSHFTTIQVKITEGEVLREALQSLGYTVLCQAEVRGYAGGRTQAEYVIRQTNGYDLGFRKAGETYELVADFWGAKINQKQFIDQVTQCYTHKMLRATVDEQGFDVLEEQTLEDGTVRVVVGKWV